MRLEQWVQTGILVWLFCRLHFAELSLLGGCSPASPGCPCALLWLTVCWQCYDKGHCCCCCCCLAAVIDADDTDDDVDVPPACRLEDDERLDTLLDQLQKKVPSAPKAKQQQQQQRRGPGGGRGDSSNDAGSARSGGVDEDDIGSAATSSGMQSVKSQLAAEMRAVKQQLQELDARAAEKAERAGVQPRVANYGRLVRGAGT